MRAATARVGEAARLEHDDALPARPRLLEQRERHDGALAGAGRRDDDGVAAVASAARSGARASSIGRPERMRLRAASRCQRSARARRASSSSARARLTTGTSMTQPSSDVEAAAAALRFLERGDDALGMRDLLRRRREAVVQRVDLLGMDREPAFEADALRASSALSRRPSGIAQLEVRRVEREHVRRARRDAQRLARVRDLRLVLEALDAHIVREVLAAERDGDDALAGAANRRDVDDGLGGLDPRQQLAACRRASPRGASRSPISCEIALMSPAVRTLPTEIRRSSGPTTAARSASIHSVSSEFTRGMTGMPEPQARQEGRGSSRAR